MKRTPLGGIGFGLAVLGLSVTGCAGSGQEQDTTPAATTEPVAAAPAPAPEPAGPPHLKFAEMTLYEGTRPIFKIHADGRTEVASSGAPAAPGATPEVQWSEGPLVLTDGTIHFKGQKVARVEQDGTIRNLRTNEVIPVKIGTDTLTASGPGGEIVLQIKEDATIALPGAPPDKQLRVDGASDAETRRTALALIGAVFLSGRSQSQPPPAPAPSDQPAPAPTTPTEPK